MNNSPQKALLPRRKQRGIFSFLFQPASGVANGSRPHHGMREPRDKLLGMNKFKRNRALPMPKRTRLEQQTGFQFLFTFPGFRNGSAEAFIQLLVKLGKAKVKQLSPAIPGA